MKRLAAITMGIVFMVLYITPLVIFRAWTIGTLWFWYITPTFGLDPLRMVEAFGLSLFVSVISGRSTKDHKMKRDYMDAQEQEDQWVKVREMWMSTKYSIGTLLIAIALGYIGIQFM